MFTVTVVGITEPDHGPMYCLNGSGFTQGGAPQPQACYWYYDSLVKSITERQWVYVFAVAVTVGNTDFTVPSVVSLCVALRYIFIVFLPNLVCCLEIFFIFFIYFILFLTIEDHQVCVNTIPTVVFLYWMCMIADGSCKICLTIHNTFLLL